MGNELGSLKALEDPVSNVLKWVLLAVAVLTFALMGWATVDTYRLAPPQPKSFITPSGTVLFTDEDVIAGKGGFQKADLMDYGSLYGMGSYYGEDYTASTLVRLATLTRDRIAHTRFGAGFKDLTSDQQAAVTSAMQGQLQHVDLTQNEARIPDELGAAITELQKEIAPSLTTVDRDRGWTPAYSLSVQDAQHTTDFLIYSALTTVARRPGHNWSWTENWPYEPLVGNTPTTNTFRWTWMSFCFTFLMFGAVLFIYEYFLNDPDVAPMDPVLARFAPLTPSQRQVGKYFLFVAAVLLLQIAAGTVMAHSYYDRTSFYGVDINRYLPFNFLRDVHTQSPIIWIGVSWIGAGLFLAPAIAGAREARGQAPLVSFLFWVTVIVVAGALLGNYLGIMGWDTSRRTGSGSATRDCPTSNSAASGRSDSSRDSCCGARWCSAHCGQHGKPCAGRPTSSGRAPFAWKT
jgi:nitric oxide reductase subunit B